MRLPMAAILTGDADIAQDYAISREVEDSLPPIVELLQHIDASFRPVPHRSGSGASSAFQNADGYRVEFLTSNRGSDDYVDQPANMPALGGASADPLRFLDFLIRDPVRTILLHRSGIPVVVPDPARYAVHKLIVASRRHTDGQGQRSARRTFARPRCFLRRCSRQGDPPTWPSSTTKHGSAALRGKTLSESGGDAAGTRCRPVQNGPNRWRKEKPRRN